MPAKKRKYEHDGLGFDSNLLIWMYLWLKECKLHGIILSFIYQPPSFSLSDRIVKDKKTVLRLHVYTADYLVKFTPKGVLKDIFNYSIDEHYIDVKGGYNLYNNHTEFSVNRKWVHQKYQVYIYKIEVDLLFKKTFVPEFCRYTLKTKKLRQKYVPFKTVEQFLKD